MKHLQKKLYAMLFCIAILCATTSCTETGGKIGIIYDDENIASNYAEFGATTTSLVTGSVRNSGRDCYLGSIIDPETGGVIRASFATQFHCPENLTFPSHDRMFPQDGIDHSADSVHCDSVIAYVYYDSYFGDGSNPMKMEVYAMDKAKIMRSDTVYKTDVNLMSQFVADNAQPLVVKTFAPKDYTLSDTELDTYTHMDNVRIKLPDSLGNEILNAYYADPSQFRNTYSFIRKVFPGLYFRLRSGNGSMLNISVSTLNISYKSYDTDGKEKRNYCRFAATPEVLQCSQIDNSDMQSLIDSTTASCTYLKTPAGICTEVELPIEAIYEGHEEDSVSKASISFTRINSKETAGVTMGTPATLLMVRKQDMNSFFDKRKVADAVTSYTTSYSSAYNNYTFGNISKLLAHCIKEKNNGNAGPDWNKVVLIPVKVSTTTDSYGTAHMVSVGHDMSLNSIRLVQGTPTNPIPIQVVYSKFE